MKNSSAQEIVEKTKHTYDTVAHHFSHSRSWFWSELQQFLDVIPEDANVVDIGCGNGRLYEVLQGKVHHYEGIDISEELIAIAQKKYPNTTFQTGDATNLPYQDNSFNTSISLAVLHHIPSIQLREKFFTELYRVTQPNGLIIVSTWNIWKTKFWTICSFAIKKLFKKSNLEFGDVYLPFFGNEKRFVHAVTKNELENLAKKVGFEVVKIEDVSRKSGEENRVLLARKS